MTRIAALGLLDTITSARAARRARRSLEAELAHYATVADRDDLAALIAGRGSADSDAADILRRQAGQELFRAV